MSAKFERLVTLASYGKMPNKAGQVQSQTLTEQTPGTAKERK